MIKTGSWPLERAIVLKGSALITSLKPRYRPPYWFNDSKAGSNHGRLDEVFDALIMEDQLLLENADE